MKVLDELRAELLAEPITATGDARDHAVVDFTLCAVAAEIEASIRRALEEPAGSPEQQVREYARRMVRRTYEDRGFPPEAVDRAVESVRVVRAGEDGELYYRISHSPLVIVGTARVR